MKKGDIDPGYVFAPYIIINEPVIISDGGFDMKRFFREKQIKLRKEKIEKIINNINVRK